MPSPFPGMNPYLEQRGVWQNFHNNFLAHVQEAIHPQVSGRYVVRLEVRLYRHELSAEERTFVGVADGAVALNAVPGGRAGGGGLASAVASGPRAALRIPTTLVERWASVEIVDRARRRVVTVVELLSPANKAEGPDRDDYLLKRARLFDSHTHLVEIDLRRGGTRPRPPDIPACDYYALVRRAEQADVADFWPIGLREALPVLPVPLAAPDPAVTLDLKAVLDRTYDGAGFADDIYAGAPDPALTSGDAAWAASFIAGQ